MNAWRLALGTLTVVPVRPPEVDRVTAGRAMALAPVVGLLLAVPPLLLLSLLELLEGVSPLLAAALVVATLALTTRAMHLDGLADTADGLGSGRPSLEALDVMRRGDVGPFGVVALVLVLLVEVAALAQLVATGLGAFAVVSAMVLSRLALPLACRRGVAAARRDGLGATVAGSVSTPLAVAAALLAVAVVVVAALVLPDGGADPLTLVALAPLGLLGGLAVGLRAVRRLGGITGDVLGAVVETTFATTLVVLCLA